MNDKLDIMRQIMNDESAEYLSYWQHLKEFEEIDYK